MRADSIHINVHRGVTRRATSITNSDREKVLRAELRGIENRHWHTLSSTLCSDLTEAQKEICARWCGILDELAGMLPPRKNKVLHGRLVGGYYGRGKDDDDDEDT